MERLIGNKENLICEVHRLYIAMDTSPRTWFKERVKHHFSILVSQGVAPNEAAVQAMSMVKQEQQVLSTAEPEPDAAAASAANAAAAFARDEGAAKYGPLSLGLAGPYQSICMTGKYEHCVCVGMTIRMCSRTQEWVTHGLPHQPLLV